MSAPVCWYRREPDYKPGSVLP